MYNNQLFATNPSLTLTGLSLTTVYNTHVYGYYRNNLLNDPRDMYCLIITLQGTGQIILKNNEIVPLPEKKLFIGQISSIHALMSECEHWHFVCYWFIPYNIALPQAKAFFIKELDCAHENAEAIKIIQLLQTHMEHKIQYANSYFCCRLLSNLDEITPSIQKSTELIEKILSYINLHIEEELQVQDIAKEFGYCEKHIRYLFNTKMGSTPKQYINKIKLENIQHLLTTTAMTIQELSEKYSFSSTSHLINNFKKEYGLTPSAFRAIRKN